MFTFKEIGEHSFKEERELLEKAWAKYIADKPLDPKYTMMERFNPSNKGYISFDLKCSLKKDFLTKCSSKRLFRSY